MVKEKGTALIVIEVLHIIIEIGRRHYLELRVKAMSRAEIP
jgi:hypothetical protein